MFIFHQLWSRKNSVIKNVQKKGLMCKMFAQLSISYLIVDY